MEGRGGARGGGGVGEQRRAGGSWAVSAALVAQRRSNPHLSWLTVPTALLQPAPPVWRSNSSGRCEIDDMEWCRRACHQQRIWFDRRAILPGNSEIGPHVMNLKLSDVLPAGGGEMDRKNGFGLQLGHLAAIRLNPLPVQRTQVPQGMSRVPDSSQKPLHQRLTSPDDEEVDPLLQQTGCAAPYTALEVWGPGQGRRRCCAVRCAAVERGGAWLPVPCHCPAAWLVADHEIPAAAGVPGGAQPQLGQVPEG